MRRPGPRPLATALEGVARRATPATPLAAAQRDWREATGERVAAESEPVAERDGVVTIACASSAWANELDLLSEELVTRLNGAIEATDGTRPVRALRFVTRSAAGRS